MGTHHLKKAFSISPWPTKLWLFTTSLSLLCFALPDSQAEPITRWRGHITVSSSTTHKGARSSCGHLRNFRIEVKLREESPTKVGTSGEITRWKLVDEGSLVSSSQTGTCQATQDVCNCLPEFPKGCATNVKSSIFLGNGTGTINLKGKIQYGHHSDAFPDGMFNIGASSSQTKFNEKQLVINSARCYDNRTIRQPLSPTPYFHIGGSPEGALSHLNDTQVRSLASGSNSGSYSYTLDLGNQKRSDVTVTWHLYRKENISCEIEEVDDKWRPLHIVYHKDATPIAVKARITEPSDAEGIFHFTLFDISKELGSAMNHGDRSSYDLNFDLSVDRRQQAGFKAPTENSMGYTIESEDEANSSEVKVAAWDYGAYGRIKAEVDINGKWATCTAPESGKIFVNIPRDDDDDHIADAWEKEHGVNDQQPESDLDATPSGQEDGDGFSIYEEYRGFFTRRQEDADGWGRTIGVWLSTDPRIKDIFINDELGLGVGAFENTGLAVHFIEPDQYYGNATRLVNFNAGYAAARPAEGQHGIWLHHCELEQGTAGEVRPWIGSPNYVEEVCVDTNQESSTKVILDTIAHELGHAVNLTHPGESYISAECDGAMHDKVRPRGGETSGDVSNIMRASDGIYYIGPDGNCYDYPDYDTQGNQFVSSTAASGINAGAERRDHEGRLLPLSGDATWEATTTKHMSLTSKTPNLTGGFTIDMINDVNAITEP